MPASNPRNLRPLHEITRKDILFSVARLPNSDTLLVASSERKVFEIDASKPSGDSRDRAPHARYVTAVRLAGRIAISGDYDGKLTWWDLDRDREIRTISAHGRWIRQLAVSPDGRTLASVGDDMVCRLWNIATGEMLREMRGHEEKTPTHFTSMLYAVAFSPDGSRLATGDRVGHIVVWDASSGRSLATMEAPALYTWDDVQRIRSIGGIRAFAFSPDGTQLAVGGVGQIGNVDALQGPSRVEIFDVQKKQRIHEFTGAQGIINRLVWHPQNEWICAIGGGSNGIILFHDPAKKAMIHQGNVAMHTHDMAFNEDFTTLYAVGHNKIVVMELKA
jgi:WD40 repeat protein